MKNNKIRTNKKILYPLVFYALIVHLIIVFILLKSDFIDRVKYKLGFAVRTSEHIDNMLMYHRWMDENIPDGAAIFLGDSITQGLATAAVSSKSINYGIGGENTEQLLRAMVEYKSLSRAKEVFLMIGINDILQGKIEGLSYRLRIISEKIPKDKVFIWSSIMPVVGQPFGLRIDNSKIKLLNLEIMAMCNSKPKCVYVDVNKNFFDRDGHVVDRYFLSDGVHLNSSGYKEWINELVQAKQNL